MDNTAEYTAQVALNSSSPRYLRITDDLINPREIKDVTSALTRQKFHLFRSGEKWLLGVISKIAKKIPPGEKDLYPTWQGVYYIHNIIDERSKIQKLDNDPYSEIRRTDVKDVLLKYQCDIKI